jgi:hypothetical protein
MGLFVLCEKTRLRGWWLDASIQKLILKEAASRGPVKTAHNKVKAQRTPHSRVKSNWVWKTDRRAILSSIKNKKPPITNPIEKASINKTTRSPRYLPTI